jgi:predicted kinase
MELIIFIGLQGAGKSTFYRTRFAETHVHISKDNFRNNRRPERRQQQLVHEALSQGHSIVVDNTNVTITDRTSLIAQAQAIGATIIGYYFASSVQECLDRNSHREGKARVPDVALYVTVSRLQTPSYAEGFDQLFYVRVGKNGEFELEDWQDI